MLLKKFLKTFATSSLLFATFAHTHAQEADIPLFGVYGGVNTNRVDEGIPTIIPYNQNQLEPTPVYNRSSEFFKSYSPSLGVFVNYPLTTSISLSGRLGYTNITHTQEFGIAGIADTTYSTDLSLSSHNIEFSPVLLFNNVIVKDLYLLAGGELGFPVSSSFNHTQRIKANSLDTTMLLAMDKPFEKNPIRVAIPVGLGYNFNLNNIVIISPEVSYRFGSNKFRLSPVITDSRATQLRFTLNVAFLPEKNPDIPQQGELRVAIDTVGTYQGDGNFTLINALKVEDVQYSELYPLVPYTFFPKNSGEPVSDYALLKADERGAATPALKPDALEINKQILNLVGSRMKTDFPQASLKITGTTDGKTETKTVSQQRADFAKNYLVTTFGIDANRITTEARALPLKPSVQTVAEGDAENRRVEFSSTTAGLLAPIEMARENERLAYPELVEFRPVAVSADSITEWTLTVTQSGKTLREFKGTGTPKQQRWLIRPNELAGTQIPVDYTFTADTSAKVFKTANGTLPVDYVSSMRKKTEKLADKTVSKYSLILFDFDNAELTPENQKIVENTILPALKFNSTVKIYGYTDKIGDEKYNRELSLKRAQKVQSVLKAKVAAAKYEVSGAGETTELFDNNSPIGRHLSRTVVIVVETPR